MTRRLILYAPNVGGGGGLVLLRQLLRADWGDMRLCAVLDRRGQESLGDDANGVQVEWVTSSVGGRWRAERLLRRTAAAGDVVLCFHNLPPVLPSRGEVLCYVQNAYLVGLASTKHLPPWPRARLAVEALIARMFRRRVGRYLVQTPTMAEALSRWYGPGVPPVQVAPFAPPLLPAKLSKAPRRWDFIYVSDGMVHKNHLRLFAAWQALARRGLRPSLAVTLHPDDDAVLCAALEKVVASHDVEIVNLGRLTHPQVLDAYSRAGALIFPSYMESFGLPLIEAQAADLPIIAPELDYVRDVCSPTATFDPFSPRSIARAVERMLGASSDMVKPMTGQAFAGLVADKGIVSQTEAGLSVSNSARAARRGI